MPADRKDKGYVKLKAFFVENSIKQRSIADEMGLDRSTFNSKINRNGSDFSLAEVRYLCKRFNLDANLFFLR